MTKLVVDGRVVVFLGDRKEISERIIKSFPEGSVIFVSKSRIWKSKELAFEGGEIVER